MAKKEISKQALDRLNQGAELLDEEQRKLLMESFEAYRDYGYIEAPGEDLVPYQNREEVPFGAMWVFMSFLVDNGEDGLTVLAELDKGCRDMINTFGTEL